MSDGFEILWRVNRADPDPFISEGFVRTDQGVVYTATRSPEHTSGEQPLTLTSVPHPDAASAVEAHGGALELKPEDEVPINELPLRLVIESLELEDPIDDQFLVGDEWWEWEGLWIPMRLPEITTWSNGDFYDCPGGDKFMKLRGRNGIYVVYDDGECYLLDAKYSTDNAALNYFRDHLVPEPDLIGFDIDEATDLDDWIWENTPDISNECEISSELVEKFKSEFRSMLTERLGELCTPIDLDGRELYDPDWLQECFNDIDGDLVVFIDEWIASHGLIRI